MGNNAKWRHSLREEKCLNIGENMIKKRKRTKSTNSNRILSSVHEHHDTNICNMTMKGSIDSEWVHLLRVKKLSKNGKMPVRVAIGAVGCD